MTRIDWFWLLIIGAFALGVTDIVMHLVQYKPDEAIGTLIYKLIS